MRRKMIHAMLPSRREAAFIFILACCISAVLGSNEMNPGMTKKTRNRRSLRKLTPDIISRVNEFIEESNHEAQPLIIGGSFAEAERFPYYCLFVVLDSGNNPISACGSNLIHDDIVLSAAHCVDLEVPVANVVIVNGDIKLPIDAPLQHSLVDYYLISDEYDSFSLKNDFLILKLVDPIVGVTSVKVNSMMTVPSTNDIVTAAGFGITETGNAMSRPPMLMEADMRVEPNAFCSSTFPFNFDEAIMICTFGDGMGICNGDSGGPLVLPGTNASTDLLVGMTSYGSISGCADAAPTFPSVFARVSAWYDTMVIFTCTESAWNSTFPQCSEPLPTLPPAPTTVCVDDPQDWVDSADDGCDWYEVGTRCESFGDDFENLGLTANQVCCACGGGTNASSPFPTVAPPTPSPVFVDDTCVDDPLGWKNSFGEDCVNYADNNLCQSLGDCCRNFGMTANEACCVCGGGKQGIPLTWLGFDGCSFGSCQECEGDCDSDDDCEGDLQCFHRSIFDPVPGCLGMGELGGDYCYNVSSALPPTASPTSFPTRNPTPRPRIVSPITEADCMDNPIDWVDSFGDSCDWYAVGDRCEKFGDRFINLDFTAKDACCVCGGGETPPPLIWFGFSACSSQNPCGLCEGDCDFDSECSGDLECFQRSGLERVPGCSGFGESGSDYCYQDPAKIVVPTPQPSPYPTRMPSIVGNVPNCIDDPVGWFDLYGNGCDWYGEQKNRCHLFGAENINFGLNANKACCICGGGTKFTFPPLEWEGWDGCSELHPCAECVGNCNKDSDCLGDFECFHRNGTVDAVRGCVGSGVLNANYCYDPTINEPPLHFRGWDVCSPSTPCGRCEGDCDSDLDCSERLRCNKLNSGTVPGCRGIAADGGDYCY